MFTGDLCGVPSQFFRHISSAFVDLFGYFTQAFSRIYPCFDFYSIRQCHSTHVSLLSAGCDRNYYTAYCRGERHPKEERISSIEYIEFLKRTDLGSQYPKERFEERIAKLVDHVSISLVARNRDHQIVGVLFGLTDYAYWLYVTDLGVDRDYLHQGIGTELMETAHSLSGGEKDVAVYLVANENAIPFYEKLGMRKADDVMEYNHIEWTEFTVK